MHPISKLNFGKISGKIAAKFNNGSSVVGGYIVKQLGTRKFKVSQDGVTTYTANLSQANTSPVAGEMTIEVFPFANGAVSNVAEHARSITANIVDTIEGNRYYWVFGATEDGQCSIGTYSGPPVAASFSANTTMNVNATISLASHVTGSFTEIDIVTPPAHANATVANGVATYVPTINYSGNDSFTYKALNTFGASNVATVSMTINVAAPIAQSFSTSASQGTPTPINLGLHITGPFSNTSIVTGPTGGNATITANTITYTSNVDFAGNDTIVYRATSNIGHSDGTITITVLGLG